MRAMNLMGFDADTFGNHDFDRGAARCVATAARPTAVAVTIVSANGVADAAALAAEHRRALRDS